MDGWIATALNVLASAADWAEAHAIYGLTAALAASLIAVARFDPAVHLGPVCEDEPHWSDRPWPERLGLLARPVSGLVLRGGAALAAGGLMLVHAHPAVAGCWGGLARDGADGACGLAPAVALGGQLLALTVPLVLLHAAARFGGMGRRADLMVQPGPEGRIGLGRWWQSELGLRHGARLRVRRGGRTRRLPITVIETLGRTAVALPGEAGRAAITLTRGSASSVWSAAAAIAVAAASAAAVLTPPSAAPEMTSAEACAAALRPAARLSACTKLVGDAGLSDATKAMALTRRASAQSDRGMRLADLDAAIGLDPLQWSARDARAALLEEDRRYEEALDDRDALIAGLGSAPAYLRRGAALLALGEAEAAVADFSEALAIGGPPEDAFLARATAYEFSGRYDEALADLEQRARWTLTDAVGLQSGRIHLLRGDRTAAERDLRRALAANPADAEAALWLALALPPARRPELRATMAGLDLDVWPGPVLAFLMEERTLDRAEAEIADAAPRDWRRWSAGDRIAARRCELYMAAGLRRLQDGDTAAGLALLQAAVSTGMTELPAHAAARNTLARLAEESQGGS